MIRRIISWIPNTITCLNLVAGCIATVFAFHIGETYGCLTATQWVYVCLGASAVFDFCDGLSARLLKAYSAIGKELDSLSDLVSFGVAPGMLIYNSMIWYGASPWAAIPAILIPVLGALRLAKFNVDDTQTTTFTGLPIPANAIFWIGLSAWMAEYGYPGNIAMWVMIVVIAGAMVSTIRMFSLKFKSLDFRSNIKRYGIIIAAIAFISLYGISGFGWTIILYLLISIFAKNKE